MRTKKLKLLIAAVLALALSFGALSLSACNNRLRSLTFPLNLDNIADSLRQEGFEVTGPLDDGTVTSIQDNAMVLIAQSALEAIRIYRFSSVDSAVNYMRRLQDTSSILDSAESPFTDFSLFSRHREYIIYASDSAVALLADITAGTWTAPAAPDSPAPVSFNYISAGGTHSLALGFDGSLWGWGSNTKGQLGTGDTLPRLRPTPIMPQRRFVLISAGQSHSLAIDIDGGLWTWGANSFGQLGNGTAGFGSAVPRPIKTDLRFVSISAGAFHSSSIDDGGQLWTWGLNSHGQLGDSSTENRFTPVAISEDMRFINLSSSVYHSLAIDSDGRLWGWGSSLYGQLGFIPPPGGAHLNNVRLDPVRVHSNMSFIYVSAGLGHNLAIDSNNKLWSWGDNSYGQLGIGGGESEAVQPIYSLDILNERLDYYKLKYYEGYQILSQDSHSSSLAAIPLTKLAGFEPACRKQKCHMHAKLFGSSYQNTHGLNPLLANEITSPANISSPQASSQQLLIPQLIMGNAYFRHISASWLQSFAISSDGNLWAWGANCSGQLGDGTSANRFSPIQIMPDTYFAIVVAGANFTIALNLDGNTLAWGENSLGTLGNGTTNSHPSPIAIN